MCLLSFLCSTPEHPPVNSKNATDRSKLYFIPSFKSNYQVLNSCVPSPSSFVHDLPLLLRFHPRTLPYVSSQARGVDAGPDTSFKRLKTESCLDGEGLSFFKLKEGNLLIGEVSDSPKPVPEHHHDRFFANRFRHILFGYASFYRLTKSSIMLAGLFHFKLSGNCRENLYRSSDLSYLKNQECKMK